jgi:hypothetical protein
MGGKAVLEYASAKAVLLAARKAQVVLGHATFTFFRAAGFEPLGSGGGSGSSFAGASREAASAGAQLFLDAVSLGDDGGPRGQRRATNPGAASEDLERALLERALRQHPRSSRGDDVPSAAVGASAALRRGSLADEGWFALELFDRLEWPATGGASGLFLDVSGARRRRGAPLIVWAGGEFATARGTLFFPDNQLWRQDPATGALHSKLNGLVADVAGESASPGRKLITWTPTAKPNQRFRVEKVAVLQSSADADDDNGHAPLLGLKAAATAAAGSALPPGAAATPEYLRRPMAVVQVASELPSSARLLVLGVKANKQRGETQSQHGSYGDDGHKPKQQQRRSWLGLGSPVAASSSRSSSHSGGGVNNGGAGVPPVNPGSRVVTVDSELADLGCAGGALTAWRVHPHMA